MGSNVAYPECTRNLTDARNLSRALANAGMTRFKRPIAQALRGSRTGLARASFFPVSHPIEATHQSVQKVVAVLWETTVP